LADKKKRGLSAIARAWSDGAPPAGLLRRGDTLAAVQKIEPQMVVESILSKGWENWGLTHKTKPDFCIRCDSVPGLVNLLPSPPPEDPVRNERNLTSDKAWYSEEPKDWEPDVDWYSPEARQDPPSCRPAS